MTHSAQRRFKILFASALLLAGGASTAFWLGRGARLPVPGATVALALALTAAVTAVNLATRWLRWHFLLRTFGVRLRIHESTAVFASLLPLILTPWACGELLLAPLLRHRTDRPAATAFAVWIVSRGADALALLLLVGLLQQGWIPEAALLVGLSTLGLSAVEKRSPSAAKAFRLFLFLGLSLLAWGCVAVSAAIVPSLLGQGPATLAGALPFLTATLGGSLSGAPGGIVLTGGKLIQALGAAGQPADVAVWTAAVLRWGTTGFAVAVGLVSLVAYRRELRRILGGESPASQGHFEDLADAYAGQIPAHVRDRLIDTKTTVMRRILAERGVPAGGRGLDIGCGQAWYLARFARDGRPMAGCDLTAGQIAQARAHCEQTGVSAELVVSGAERLPFPDNSFDFAYAINVLHHITNPDTLARALAEITRVLRPGAPFILFEMNTLNPLFRLYMSYLFPFVRDIDDGTEVWLVPGRLPPVAGASWTDPVEYLTFVPDFLPEFLLAPLSPLERWLEHSPLRRFSAHYAASLVKHPLPPA